MNEKAYAWAWGQEGLSMEQLIVLLALAHFLDEGCITASMPVVELERKSRLSKELVLIRLQELKALDLVEYDLELTPGKVFFTLPAGLDEAVPNE